METTQHAITKSTRIAQGFIIWNALFFVASLALKHTIASDAAPAVLLRGGVYALGGFILLLLLRQMGQGKRSGWLRLSIISVLAPLGVVAFVAFTPHLPLWFDAGQAGSAVMLVAIAAIILQKAVRMSFAKTRTATTDPHSAN